MKKLIKEKFFVLFAMMVVGLSFVACEKEEDALRGFYLTEPWSYDEVHLECKALDFKNKNTVIVYDDVLNFEHWQNDIWGNFSKYLGIDNWYVQDGVGAMATYSVIENKIYIPNEGMILTIEGDKLYPDGSSRNYPYIKYKPGNTAKSESLKGQQLKFVKKWRSYDYVVVTESQTYDFPDDVSYEYTYVCEIDNQIDDRDDKRIVNTHKGTYVCTGDKIEFTRKIDGREFKDEMTKRNGKWYMEGYELQ